MNVSMNSLKTTFCMPCKELFDLKKEKLINLCLISLSSHLTIDFATYKAEASPRTTLP
jgi:hypothetical protein